MHQTSIKLHDGGVPSSILGPDWARRELIAIREACLIKVTEQRLDLAMFGMALRRLRTDADLSLREVARQLKLSAPFLSDCEHGRRKLKLMAQMQYVTICRSVTGRKGQR